MQERGQTGSSLIGRVWTHRSFFSKPRSGHLHFDTGNVHVSTLKVHPHVQLQFSAHFSFASCCSRTPTNIGGLLAFLSEQCAPFQGEF